MEKVVAEEEWEIEGYDFDKANVDGDVVMGPTIGEISEDHKDDEVIKDDQVETQRNQDANKSQRGVRDFLSSMLSGSNVALH